MSLFKGLNVFNLSAATKNLMSNYIFFPSSIICRANQRTGFYMIESSVMKELNQHLSINSRNKLKLTLIIADKCWHSVSLFHIKAYTRGLFRTQSNFDNKAFLWFLERSSSIDVRISSKCPFAYIYIQLSPIEIICILNIFAIKYIFSDKRRTK